MIKRILLIICAILSMQGVIAATAHQAHAGAPPKCYYMKQHIKGSKRFRYVRVCHEEESFEQRLDNFIGSLSTEQQSALAKRLKAESKIHDSRFGIALYEPTYVLPFYYTGSPDQAVYAGTTPDNQKIQHTEFKAQMSFLVELWPKMFKSPISLDVSYTQLSYWQAYAKSAWFRETDYEPAIFLSGQFTKNTLVDLGAVHQSNGRGGSLERSWNRLFADFMLSGKNWLIDIKPWVLIFRSESSNLHNPDITKFLGHGRILFAVTFHHQEISVNVRNVLESGFKRGAVVVGYSFPLIGRLQGYLQIFTGYGQSLIEYNHYTNSVGLGVILNNWI